MRKQSIVAALGLAVTFGAAGVAAHATAQPPRRDVATANDSTFHGRRGPGGPGGPGGPRGDGRFGGPEGAMLRGITLTDAQRQQLATLREQERQRMEAERARQLDAVRSILSADQRKQFDANRAEMDQRMKDRPGMGPGEERGFRGDRSDRGGR